MQNSAIHCNALAEHWAVSSPIFLCSLVCCSSSPLVSTILCFDHTNHIFSVTYSIFSKIRGLDDIYDVPVCHSCHMMIIQQANLLGLTHILKSYSEQGFKAEFFTVVHCLVIATSTSINLQSSFQKILFLLFPAIDPRKGPWISDILQSLDYNFDAKL